MTRWKDRRTQRSIGVTTIALASAAAASAADACPRIDYKHRWRDDFSCVDDANRDQVIAGPLKNLALTEQVRVDLGGELNLRFESRNPIDFGLGGADDEDTILYRAYAHANIRVADAARVFLQLAYTEAEGRTEESIIDESGLDLQQGFIDARRQIGFGEGMLRLGRQEIYLGSGRLAANRVGPNLRRAHDGLRGSWEIDDLVVEALVTSPVVTEPDAFDDSQDGDVAFYGVYGSYALAGRALAVDAYWLGYEDAEQRFAQGRDDEHRHSFGVRAFGAGAGIDYDLEAVGQVGTFGDADIRAWALYSIVGYTFEGRPWQPRLGLSANAASGDDDPDDGELNTYNALFSDLSYYTKAAQQVPSNLMDVRPSLLLAPGERWEIELAADIFWRQSKDDAYYAPRLFPQVPASASDARHIGTAYQLLASYEIGGNVSLEASYVRFESGDFIEDAGGTDQDTFIVRTRFRF